MLIDRGPTSWPSDVHHGSWLSIDLMNSAEMVARRGNHLAPRLTRVPVAILSGNIRRPLAGSRLTVTPFETMEKP
jgi:hypothetical protein